jgi:CheY-like chemotaxis protein
MEANRSILLAEDNQLDMELTLEALRDHGLTNEIVAVRDGVEAMDYLYRRGRHADRPPAHPLLILLDLKMPRVDGLEVLSQIKRDPVLRVIPIVMLTSSREERDIVESYNLGANAYVVKPVAFESFVEVVKQIGLFWLLINEPPV